MTRNSPLATTAGRSATANRSIVLTVERFVIDCYGPDDNALRDALRWLLTDAAARGSDAAIVVPTVDSISKLGRVLGPEVSDQLARHRQLAIEGVTVHAFTPKTQPRLSFGGPVLVPWANTAMVEDAERMQPPSICATGWAKGDLDDWKRAWSPIDPRTGEAEATADEAPTAVRGAVASLSGTLGNDVLHPDGQAARRRCLQSAPTMWSAYRSRARPRVGDYARLAAGRRRPLARHRPQDLRGPDRSGWQSYDKNAREGACRAVRRRARLGRLSGIANSCDAVR
jgi:hypothetical protein